MTTLAVPAPSATGRSAVRNLGASGQSSGHTVVVYGRVDDPVMGRALLDFDLAFSAATFIVSRPDPAPRVEDPVAPGIEALDEPSSSAVRAIERISALLGLPVKDVLAAAKVRKRTYHYWKSHPGTRPRLDSTGDLWALAQSIELLEERLGADLAAWMAHSRQRELFRRGDHDRLVQLATSPRRLDEEMLRHESWSAAGYGEPGETPVRVDSGSSGRPAPTRARSAKRARPRETGVM